ncbi:bifunctional 3-(3-hydroxy-phenyl)propionate/3-hydroxycinnamic acid hydroxylase, partial [Agrobacterium arsenijevicii]
MTSNNNIFNRFDVLVVGFGPAGAVAAGMLGARGHSTLVVDKLTGIYDKPRAIAIDHEILRHFDNMGIAAEVLAHIEPFTASQHFGAQGQLIRRIDMVPAPYPLGYTPSMVFTQPPVEAILRRHAEGFDCVTVELGTEMTELHPQADEVVATLQDQAGNTRKVAAKYVVGCDGAWSRVRELSGMKFEDLVFDEPWLVVDVQVHDASLGKLPQTSAQFCDPARPTSYIMGPKNHRRWEIMLLPGEDPREMEKPENVWRLLSPWLTPQDGDLWRAAAYRFHALVADEWRRDRVMIAGDAAHQQPPFIGQGMCQGLRDVSNLVWRLDRVLKGQSSDALLDTYTVERKRHVQALTGKIKAIGQTICERDPVAAAARDARILAEGGGQPLVIT